MIIVVIIHSTGNSNSTSNSNLCEVNPHERVCWPGKNSNPENAEMYLSCTQDRTTLCPMNRHRAFNARSCWSKWTTTCAQAKGSTCHLSFYLNVAFSARGGAGSPPPAVCSRDTKSPQAKRWANRATLPTGGSWMEQFRPPYPEKLRRKGRPTSNLWVPVCRQQV